MKFKEHEVVRLQREIGHPSLTLGARGTVLQVHSKPPGYLVEFSDKDGATIDILALSDDDLVENSD